MKFYILAKPLAFLIGCSQDPQLAEAAKNYAQDNCKGMLLKDVDTLSLEPGNTDLIFTWSCIQEDGVKDYSHKYKDIPLKYWSKADVSK